MFTCSRTRPVWGSVLVGVHADALMLTNKAHWHTALCLCVCVWVYMYMFVIVSVCACVIVYFCVCVCVYMCHCVCVCGCGWVCAWFPRTWRPSWPTPSTVPSTPSGASRSCFPCSPSWTTGSSTTAPWTPASGQPQHRLVTASIELIKRTTHCLVSASIELIKLTKHCLVSANIKLIKLTKHCLVSASIEQI